MIPRIQSLERISLYLILDIKQNLSMLFHLYRKERQQKMQQIRYFGIHVKDIVQRIKLKMDVLISNWKIENEMDGSLRLPGDGDCRAVLIPDTEKLRFIEPELKAIYAAAFSFSRICS
ncbi:hypothetical protein M9H77_25174 [Catharanthus roseus]|uniref:Uncharacterized protein n=1 Tax=Catharanthus roseus TaxID=4058 RepID=A0ACC0A6J1_CATRO|nr:hypothetical protein M9H77_25174 [Catharanthus roseus]